jgi:hypothetical protein
MATRETEAERTKSETEAALDDQNGSSIEKKSPSHDEERGPIHPADVESARPDVNQHPPMTFKRFMAIFTLGCLLAAAQIPLYLIGGALGMVCCRRS